LGLAVTRAGGEPRAFHCGGPTVVGGRVEFFRGGCDVVFPGGIRCQERRGGRKCCGEHNKRFHVHPFVRFCYCLLTGFGASCAPNRAVSQALKWRTRLAQPITSRVSLSPQTTSAGSPISVFRAIGVFLKGSVRVCLNSSSAGRRRACGFFGRDFQGN